MCMYLVDLTSSDLLLLIDVHNLQGDPTFPKLVPVVTCPVSMLTPHHPTVYLWSHSLHCAHHSQTLNLLSLVHSLQGSCTVVT